MHRLGWSIIRRTVAFLHTMALVLSAVVFTVVAPLAGVSAEDFIPLELPGATLTVAYGINDAGQIVGEYRDAEGKSHGFLLEKGTVTLIDVPGATFTIAYGINDAGQIVGEYRDAEGKSHGFLLEKGTVTPVEATGELLLGRRPRLIPPPVLCLIDGVCEPEEPSQCPDCASEGTLCVDDGICEPGESGCPDCSDASPVCGDGLCNSPTENAQNCQVDCGGNTCNRNGKCDPGESEIFCPSDCTLALCGNGTCDVRESINNCLADCCTGSCNCPGGGMGFKTPELGACFCDCGGIILPIQ